MEKQKTHPKLDIIVNGKFKGLYSCDCHCFENYEDLRKANLQKFLPGQKVKHRCSGLIGIIDHLIDKKFVYFDHKDLLYGMKHIEEIELIN